MKLPMVNPIFMRVMSTSGRLVRHMWVRVGYLAVILIILTFIMLGELMQFRGQAALAQLGESLFRTVSLAQLVLILFLSPIYTAGAITQERDAQTFHVLLATPLSNLQIVLGSLLSRLFFILAILFSTLPLFALLYYFGGFELRDVVLSYGIAATSALLTGSVAVAVSIMSGGTRRVIVSFFLVITAYLFGIWVLDRMLLSSAVPGYVSGTLDWLHPLLALGRALEGGQAVRPLLGELSLWELLRYYPELGYLLYSVTASALIIAFSAVLVRRLARGYGGWAQRLARWVFVIGATVAAAVIAASLITLRGAVTGTVTFVLLAVPVAAAVILVRRKRRRKARAVWDNPIAWRERVTRTSTARRTAVQVLYILLSILAVYVVLVMKVSGAARVTEARTFVMVFVTAQMFVTLMVGATMAASSISYEREQGTLDMMLTTPITPAYFIHGKLLGIIRYLGLFVAMIVLVTLGAYLVAVLPVERWLGHLVPPDWVTAVTSAAPMGSPSGGALRWHDWPLVSVVYPALSTGAMAAAMVTVGMGFSLRARRSATAALWAALVVLGYAATITCCCGLTGLVQLVGPMAAMVSPFLVTVACVMPETYAEMANMTYSDHLRAFHEYVGLHVGVLGGAVVYVVFTMLRLRGMVRRFDEQTRQKV